MFGSEAAKRASAPLTGALCPVKGPFQALLLRLAVVPNTLHADLDHSIGRDLANAVVLSTIRRSHSGGLGCLGMLRASEP